MLQLLAARESGQDPPWLFPRLYGSHRFSQLELSARKEFSRGHDRVVNSMSVDSEGRYLISGGADSTGSIVIHDLWRPLGQNGKYVCSVSVSTFGTSYGDGVSRSVVVIQWYPHDTGIFTTTSADKQLKIWDTNELVVVEQFSFSKLLYTHSMSPSHTHTLTAVGGAECKVTLCDLQSGSATHVLVGHRKAVMSLAWSPNSAHLLASGSQDNQVILWDIRKASGPLFSLNQHNGGGGAGASSNTRVSTAHGGSVNGLSFSSDGLHLVSFGTENRLRLWDAVTGRNTLVNYGRILNRLPKQTCPLALTPPSSSLHPLVCVPVGSEVAMVEMETGRKVKSLGGHYGTVHCLSVHPYEQELYSGGADGNILCWSPPPSPHKELASSKTKQGLYTDTWSSDEEQ